MPRGEKNKYTDKQKRKAEHIAEGYQDRGVSKKVAKARAWSTVNKQDGGGKYSGGSGRKKNSPRQVREDPHKLEVRRTAWRYC